MPGCSHFNQPGKQRDGLDEATTNWRAVCGKTACTVRREGWAKAHPYPYQDAFALILPEVNTDMMQTFLDEFAKTIPDTDHVALFLDQAGWHGANALKAPDCITLLPLPPYSPELNPVERIWEYLKERYLSHRLHDDYDAIEAAITVAWNKLLAETGRLTSLTWLPWEPKETATATSQKL